MIIKYNVYRSLLCNDKMFWQSCIIGIIILYCMNAITPSLNTQLVEFDQIKSYPLIELEQQWVDNSPFITCCLIKSLNAGLLPYVSHTHFIVFFIDYIFNVLLHQIIPFVTVVFVYQCYYISQSVSQCQSFGERRA